jgi:membrane-associated phospholipid phosphatase
VRDFTSKLIRNLKKTFSGVNIFWHLLAIVLTYILVVTGFDWAYYRAMLPYEPILLPAAIIGFFVPIVAPFIPLALSVMWKNKEFRNIAYAIFQADILALFVAACYKAVTGRAHPDPFLPGPLTDITHVFHFGFLKAGIFWGWPSSHAAVAFALAATLWILLPKNKAVRATMAVYAIYIAIGVSATIHWFSDVVAGIIIGTLIGVIVARSYRAAVGA